MLFVGALYADDQLGDPKTIWQQANQAYQDHSYQKAASLYEQLSKLETLPSGLSRDELDFRLADAQWRNLSATRQSDTQSINAPRQQLEELAAKLQKQAKGARPPQLWAEIQASLGDSYWLSPQFRTWGLAWRHYEQALSWWAGSTKIDLAREQYLDIVFRAAEPPSNQKVVWRFGYYGNWMPTQVLENAVSIAQTSEQKAYANYLLALTYARQYNAESMKAQGAFEAALEAPKSDWADNALFHFAEWAERMGASYWDDNGHFQHEGDPALALKLYHELLSRYQEGESNYWKQAEQRIENITQRDIQIYVGSNFLPGNTIEFSLNWRNVDQVSIGVYQIDLIKAYQPPEDNSNNSPYFAQDYNLSDLTPAIRLTRESDGKPYAQQSDNITVDAGLPVGAYVIQAEGGGKTAQALLLISQQVVTTMRDNETILAWLTDAQTGEPLGEASVTAWIGNYQNRNNQTTMNWTSATLSTDEDGLARFTQKDFTALKAAFNEYEALIILTEKDGDFTAASANSNFYNYQAETNPQDGDAWKIYAFTDRPAYRPGDTVHWKAIARLRATLSNWAPPSTGQAIRYRISGPQGDEVSSGVMTLNEYGSMWGELTLESDWPLGMYRIEFRLDNQGDNHIGSAELFRLEEYKLPEFKVAVQTVSEKGEAATAYRLGDDVEVEITADYYFGGAVTNAEVNVVVRESPYYHYWLPPTPYPWLRSSMPSHYNPGREVLNETLKTDAEGRAILTLPTNASSPHDLEYSIEARVVDESRREVSGRASIRATRAPYFVNVQPERILYRPGERAEVTVKAVNANDDPVEVEGRIRLTREEWMQVWRGPDGEEISGKEYDRRIKKGAGLFSSALDPKDWTMIRQGYDVEELKVATLRTNQAGEAKFEFPVDKTGYYRIYWVSKPERSAPIKADAAIWAADSASQSIGFHGGLKIVTDEESFREGRRAPVMITASESGNWVLFTVQGAGLIDTRVVYLEGNVKLLELDVDGAWIPNVRLQANSNKDLQTNQDSQDINIPPDKHFLDVSVTTNAESYLPREKATALITTRDIDGKPVSAEVALSVFDEAVLAIQPTLAPDPREFFYGQTRPIRIYTTTSQSMRRFEVIKRVADASTPSRGWRADGSENDFGYKEGAALELAGVDAFAPAPPMLMSRGMATGEALKASKDLSAAPPTEPNVIVRTDFRSTVLWKPAIVTDVNGQANVDFEFPDNLTTWNLEAHAVGLPASFGEGAAQAKTRLPLIARLQTPRFLVTGDELTITGVINNNTGSVASVRAELVMNGGVTLANSAMQSIDVPAHGSAQVNWTIEVQSPGDVKFQLSAKSSTHGDAMELTIPAYEHGIDKFLARSGKMTTQNLELDLEIPKFKPEGARFTLHLSPSIATTMLDALPYLAQYPYGCTEQTMSRFLPAVIVAQTLNDLGLSANEILHQNFGGIETDTQSDVVQKTKPKKEGDLTDLDSMVAEGLKRLTDFQHDDGGWGWWKNDQSDPFMSAYVVWGLTLAQQAGQSVDANLLRRGRDYLNLRLVDFESTYDTQAWLLHALAIANRGASDAKPGKNEAKAFANLWKNRDQMQAYSRALTAISAKHFGFNEEAKILAENLANGVKLDNNPQGSILLNGNTATPEDTALPTAHWGEDGLYYRWSRGAVESTAFVLMALMDIDPNSELVEPTMNWLVKNRRGAQWSNTRDTAIVVLALNSWLKTSGELKANGQYVALLNGENIAEITITPDTVLTAPHVFEVPVDKLKPNESNTLTLQRKAGESPLYFATRFNFFSLEDPILAAGNEIFVERKYERTYPIKTLLEGYESQSSPLTNGGEATTGDRIEAIVTIEAKNNLEYILIEDLKPAGFEAVALQSGAPLYARELRPSALDRQDRYTGRQQWIYQELRDRQIASFISQLPQGLWELRYELRAETPGDFSALPVIAEAMYVPEIKGNSVEMKVTVEDKE